MRKWCILHTIAFKCACLWSGELDRLFQLSFVTIISLSTLSSVVTIEHKLLSRHSKYFIFPLPFYTAISMSCDCGETLGLLKTMVPNSIVSIHPMPTLLSKPASIHILYKQRAGSIFAVPKPLMQDTHNRQACVKANEICKSQRAHRMVGA